MTIKIKSIAHHRNGVGGAPFYVVLFTCEDAGNMVATVFDEPHTLSVLNIDEAARGNIAFGVGNSWRGDEYEYDLRKAITEYEKRREAELDAKYPPKVQA